MNRIIFIILLFNINIFIAQELNCKDFKTGKFIYSTNIEGLKEIIITRNDSIQLELYQKQNIKIYTSVKWTSACNYELTYKEIINYPVDVSDKIGETIFVEIVKIKGDTLKVKATSKTMNEEIEFIKIK